MTYASPGHGGHHVNENTEQYWIDTLQKYGFTYDPVLTNQMRNASTMGTKKKHRFHSVQDFYSKMPRIVAIKELMWTYHPFPKMEDSFKDRKTIESADILVQTNIKGGKKRKKLGHIYSSM